MFRRRYSNIGIAISYFLIFCLTTYPLILKFFTHIPGFFSTDESFAIVWNAWLTKHAFLNNLSLFQTDYVAYSFGIRLFPAGLIAFLWILIDFSLAVLTTPVLTYNLQVFMNFLLTAVLTFVLFKRIASNAFAAFLSGIAFAFSPYMFVRSWQHLGETYLWPIPLFLLSAICLKDNRKIAVKIAFIASLLFATINFDVIYYVSLVWLVYMVYLALNFAENKEHICRLLLTSFIAGVFLLPQFMPIIRGILAPLNSQAPSAWNTFHRPFGDLFEQSARPLSYFLPSATHPVFGKVTEAFVGTKLYGMSFTEHTLYLGWVLLALAFMAFFRWRGGSRLPEREKFYVGFFLLLAVTAWFWSQPPWWNIFGFKLYMPSFFMYKIMPMFRAYCRFGAVVMFAVAVLAGFGLKLILEKFRSHKTKITVTALFCGLVLFEFWNWPPYKVIDVSSFPKVYSWLKEQPENIVIAEYPLDAGSPNEMYKLYQIKHEKRMINGTIPRTHAHAFAQQLVKLSNPSTAAILKQMGVKYVLVHHQGYLKTGLLEDRKELENIPGNNELRLIKTYPGEECPDKKIMCIKDPGQIDLYEVVYRNQIK